MRITDRMVVEHTLSQIHQGRQRLGEAQTRVATGKRVRRSSDDPADVERAMTVARELRMTETQRGNLKLTRDWMSSTEVALNSLNDLMILARNAALRGASDTNSESERMALASEVGAMLENALSIANSQHGDSYIFSGQQIHTKPFSLQGGAIVYDGDSATISHLVELGQTMPVNVTGVDGDSGGILNALTQIKALQTALETNDRAGIESFLTDIEDAADDLNTSLSTLGARLQRVDRTDSRLAERETDLKALYSSLVDADMAATIAEMSAEDRAYEMTLASASRMMPRSLLDFLR